MNKTGCFVEYRLSTLYGNCCFFFNSGIPLVDLGSIFMMCFKRNHLKFHIKTILFIEEP